ncbi:hypothetical protein FMUAM8_41510 [Nocardia cyriacigeorgica]|nr:hypothetical protein FMUAM8_41510 [Nocardia cyriacigeorgica]
MEQRLAVFVVDDLVLAGDCIFDSVCTNILGTRNDLADSGHDYQCSPAVYLQISVWSGDRFDHRTVVLVINGVLDQLNQTSFNL